MTIDLRSGGGNIPDGMAFIRTLFWIAVFVISTLGFVVLFEHGTTNFTKNLTKQAEALTRFVQEQTGTGKKTPGS